MMFDPARHYTPAKYLEIERTREERNELVDGLVRRKPGGTLSHNLIVVNIAVGLGQRVRASSSGVFASNMRVGGARVGIYLYPDVVILTDSPLLEDEHEDTLLNPAVIFEVLSESTERYDRGEKFAHYRRIESLREYILVSQDTTRVERFVRHGDHWVFSDVTDPASSLMIETLGCEISLADIYEGVDFPPAE